MNVFAARHEKYEKYRHLRGAIFTLEGIIGAGKTTVGISLEAYFKSIGLRAKFYPEYVNKVLLDQYISNMEKYAYTFQMIMLCKRIEIYREAERYIKTGGIAIIDRSILGDYTFAKMQYKKNNITKEEFGIYKALMEQEIQLSPTATLYLKISASTSMGRVQIRGNKAEINGYKLDYMQTLENSYNKIMQLINNCITIDIDKPLTIVDDKIIPEELENIILVHLK